MRREKTSILAKGRWRSILPALGINSRFLVNKHGPCPMCEGKDRFRFDDKEGAGTWYCNKCGTGDGIELVKRFRGVDFLAACALIDPVIGTAELSVSPNAEPDDQQIEKSMRQMAQRSEPVSSNDPVHRYLVRRIGTDLSVPAAIRTLRQCLYKDQDGVAYHPAMLASVRDVDGRAVALHRTYLTPGGDKAAVPQVRKVIGKLPAGCAVRLGGAAHVMGIAEGIETALSASLMHGLPVWAALNAGRLKEWVPPPETAEVVVFGDNDLNCDGQEAAYALAKRLNRTITAQVVIPQEPGADWNDVLQFRSQSKFRNNVQEVAIHG